MRTLLTTAVMFTITVATVIAADPALQYFQARSAGATVAIEWKSGPETGVVRYDIERAGSDGNYRLVASVSAKGNGQTYQFSDDDAFAKRDDNEIAQGNLTYRLRVLRDDQTQGFSNSVVVLHSVSSIKRTWGMIKEMFR